MDNIDGIVDNIYGKPPGPPKSIQLQLEEQFDDDTKVIFEVLCLITIRGVRKLYGQRNLLELTKQELDLVAEYVRSYGFELCVYGNDTDKSPWELHEEGVDVKKYRIQFNEF